MNLRVVLTAVVIISALGLGGCSQAKTVSVGEDATKTLTPRRTSSSSTALPAASASSAAAVRPDVSSPSPARPKTPAKTGAKLTVLQAPPDKALAMIALPKGFTSARFELTVSPYGWGPAPQGAARRKLLVKIDELKALDAGAKALSKPKAGSNAVLNLEVPLAESELVAKGGKYTVSMSVRAEGTVGAFYVEKIEPLK